MAEPGAALAEARLSPAEPGWTCAEPVPSPAQVQVRAAAAWTVPLLRLLCALMRILVFGTYDTAAHPRVGIIADGLRAHGCEVAECNVPLGLNTAARVKMLAQPWRVPLLVLRLARCWLTLAVRARRMPRPDAVLVGYLGHFDVRLARLLFRRTPIVLDHLVGASDTARDRQLSGGGVRQLLLRAIDSGALRSATVIVVDTEEHQAALPPEHHDRAVVVPVGAPDDWFAAADQAPRQSLERVNPMASADGAAPGAAADRPTGPDPIRVVFYGLFTPLQGTPVIGAALAELAGAPVEVTMVGGGQDLAAAKQAAAGNPAVRWLDWVASTELPELVAGHDVCLGIFGTGPKALRVVPNKVFQGAAAGCAVVTSDTDPQRRTLGDAAVLVAPGDPRALADALRALAADRSTLAAKRAEARRLALAEFTPASVVEPLLKLLP